MTSCPLRYIVYHIRRVLPWLGLLTGWLIAGYFVGSWLDTAELSPDHMVPQQLSRAIFGFLVIAAGGCVLGVCSIGLFVIYGHIKEDFRIWKILHCKGEKSSGGAAA